MDVLKKMLGAKEYPRMYEKRAHKFKAKGWEENYIDTRKPEQAQAHGEKGGLSRSRARQLASFMKKRFTEKTNQHMVQKTYADDWVRRFQGDPRPFMDGQSKKAYEEVMKGE